MKPFILQNNVYWIGALHPDLRIFDIIMHIKNGTTYNSYLIKDEKIAVIDTVKEKFADQYISHIAELVDPKDIDYIIVQHTEPDHSGSLAKLLDAAPNAELVCAKSAVKYVQNILNREVNIRAVGNKETLSLGEKTLMFLLAPYIHWPDTMMTFLPEEKLLFSCDLFGAHFCDSRMYDDLITRDVWPDLRYYFDCIMRPFKKNVRNALAKLNELTITQIAPSHGPIIRRDVQKYLEAYLSWSEPLPTNVPPQMLIYYATAHGNTELMANTIADGARSLGVAVEVFDAMNIVMDEHVKKIEAADALLFGSPTINSDAVKPIWDVLNSLATIDVKGKLAGSFGSYAWSGDAVVQLNNRLLAMKFKTPFEGQTAVLTPSNDELQGCFDYGVKMAQLLTENNEA
jgi:NADH oxidase (H2O-forming)